MEKITFQDRVGDDLKRKKITIISQTGNTIIADIELANPPKQEGTSITANLMNKLQEAISLAELNAKEAKEAANSALSTAKQANENASASFSNSQIAISKAKEIETKIKNTFGTPTNSQESNIIISKDQETLKTDIDTNPTNLNNYVTTNTEQEIIETKNIKKGLSINSYQSKVLLGGITNTCENCNFSGIRLCSVNANGMLQGYFHIIGCYKEHEVGFITYDLNIHFYRTQEGDYHYYYTGNDLSILKYFDIVIEGSSAPFYITLVKNPSYVPQKKCALALWQVDVYGLGFCSSLLATFTSSAICGTKVNSLI